MEEPYFDQRRNLEAKIKSYGDRTPSFWNDRGRSSTTTAVKKEAAVKLLAYINFALNPTSNIAPKPLSLDELKAVTSGTLGGDVFKKLPKNLQTQIKTEAAAAKLHTANLNMP